MENQIPPIPTVPVVDNQQIITPEQPKKNKFLTILLSILLFISTAIAGFFAYQTQKLTEELNNMQIPTYIFESPELTAEQDATLDSTTDWKTYTNSEYGYEIKYPSEWNRNLEIDDPEQSILNISGSQGYVVVDPTNKNKITEPIKDWIDKYNTRLVNDPNRHPMSREMTIASYAGEIKISEIPMTLDNSFFNSDGKTFIFRHNNTMYEISSSYYIDEANDGISKSNASLVNQIISTFKFTN